MDFAKRIIIFYSCFFLNTQMPANENAQYVNIDYSINSLHLATEIEDDLKFKVGLEPSKKEINPENLIKFRKHIFSIHTGYSPFHGFFGIEYQWQFISLNIGVTDQLNGGIKFYVKRGLNDSFYFGGFATQFDKYDVIGSGIGYRWIKKSGLTINLGIGFGILVEEDSNSDVSIPMIVPTFSLGWSF